MKRYRSINGYQIEADLSTQRIRLELGESLSLFEANRFHIASHASAGAALLEHQLDGKPFSADPVPRLSGSGLPSGFVSLGLFALKASLVDNRLIEAAERLCRSGRGSFIGRDAMINSLLTGLIHESRGLLSSHAHSEAIAFLLTAASLGGTPFSLSEENAQHIRKARLKALKWHDEFLAGQQMSMPHGLYSREEVLREIFRQDQFLLRPVQPNVARVLFEAMIGNSHVSSSYDRYLRFAARLSGGHAYKSIRDVPPQNGEDEQYHFFPPRHSYEQAIVRRMYGHEQIPDGFDVFIELIAGLQRETIDLTPDEHSGYLDYLCHAMETFVLLDKGMGSERLDFGRRYRDHLGELFRSLYGMTREAPVRRIETPPARDMEKLTISPDLSLEPLPEYYLRRARGYAHMRRTFTELFGAEVLRDLPSVPGMPADYSPVEEMIFMESLFYGAHQLACEQIGVLPKMKTRSPKERAQDRATAAKWIHTFKRDEDLGRDLRRMVPLRYDPERKQVLAMAIVGFQSEMLEIAFVQEPELNITRGGLPVGDVTVDWANQRVHLPYPVGVPIYVDQIMEPEPFRAICDKHNRIAGIIKELGATHG